MNWKTSILTIFLFFSNFATAAEILSYSGRLVNPNGSPVSGPVNLKIDFAYTDAPLVNICEKNMTAVPLVNGLFHIKIELATGDCFGDDPTTLFLDAPANETVAIKITDLTNTKAYSPQAIFNVPYASISQTAKNLSQMNATPGQALIWNGTKWAPGNISSGDGSITEIQTGSGLSGGPITDSGTISVANGGISSTHIADNTIVNTDISTSASIARTKLATGNANRVLVNDGSGVMSESTALPLNLGGTGATTASDARTNLSLGTAATSNIGNGPGNVMSASVVPNCLSSQKLQMSLGPIYVWSCVQDLDSLDSTKLPLDGSQAMTGALDMNFKKILNLTSPTNPGDGANKAYVDAQVSSVNSSQWTTAGNNIYYDAGNVGIRTTTPSAPLHVSGNMRLDGMLRLWRQDSAMDDRQWFITHAGTDNLSFAPRKDDGSSDGEYALTLTRTGEVGIGTNQPSQKLHISNVTGEVNSIIETGDTSVAATRLINSLSSWKIGVGIAGVDGLVFREINPNGERMTILSGGNVGIGTISPGVSLDVNGTIRAKGHYINVLEVNLTGPAPTNGVKIKTNIPFLSSEMMTVIIEGFDYGNAAGSPLGIILNWYGYTAGSGFIKYVASSFGGVTPTIKLANENGKVVIHLGNDKSNFYFSKFQVRLLNTQSLSSTFFQGWTYSDEAITGTDVVTVPYKNRVGDLYADGQIGIGTTEPATDLHIVRGNSGKTFSNNSGLIIENQGNSNAYYALQVSTAGAQDAFSITNAGRVGIGTSTPTAKLEVTGTIKATGFDGPFNSSSSTTDAEYTINSDSDSADSDGGINFQIGGSNKLQINNSGNVIVNNTTNSTSPTSGALTIAGGLGVASDINIGGALFTPLIYGSNLVSGNLTLDSTSNATKGNVILAPNGGNVGIGTTTPSFPLHVSGTSLIDGKTGAGTLILRTETANWAGNLIFQKPDSNNNLESFGSIYVDDINNTDGSESSKMIFRLRDVGSTTNTMVINGKNVGIGIETPTEKLSVSSTSDVVARFSAINTSSTPAVRLTGYTSGSNARFGDLVMSAEGGWFGLSKFANSSGGLPSGGAAPALAIINNGNVGVGTTAPLSTFDVRNATGATITLSTGGNDASVVQGIEFRDRFNATNQGADGQINAFIRAIRNSTSAEYELAFGTVNTTAGNASEKLRITKTGDVGVGTNTPQGKLHINTNSSGTTETALMLKNEASGPNTGSLIEFRNTNAPTAQIHGVRTDLPASGGGFLSFYTRGSILEERVRITEEGNVGIGVTNPVGKLEVMGNNASSRIYNTIFANSTTASGFIGRKARGTIDSPLPVLAGDGLVLLGGRGYHTGNDFGLATVGHVSIHAAEDFTPTEQGTFIKFATTPNGSLNPLERMRIDNSGNVGIGTIAPATKLEVSETSAGVATAPLTLSNNSSSENTEVALRLAPASSPGTRFAQVSAVNNGTNRISLALYGANGATLNRGLTVDALGRIGIGNTLPDYNLDVTGDINSTTRLRIAGTEICSSVGCTISSDERLKENIQPLKNSLENILAIQGIEYDYKNKSKFGQHHHIGVIAQEVEKIYPEVVRTDPESGLKSVAYGKLVAPLIEAFKTLYEQVLEKADNADLEKASLKIQKLEEENAELKARLERIEMKLETK